MLHHSRARQVDLRLKAQHHHLLLRLQGVKPEGSPTHAEPLTYSNSLAQTGSVTQIYVPHHTRTRSELLTVAHECACISFLHIRVIAIYIQLSPLVAVHIINSCHVQCKQLSFLFCLQVCRCCCKPQCSPELHLSTSSFQAGSCSTRKSNRPTFCQPQRQILIPAGFWRSQGQHGSPT